MRGGLRPSFSCSGTRSRPRPSGRRRAGGAPATQRITRPTLSGGAGIASRPSGFRWGVEPPWVVRQPSASTPQSRSCEWRTTPMSSYAASRNERSSAGGDRSHNCRRGSRARVCRVPSRQQRRRAWVEGVPHRRSDRTGAAGTRLLLPCVRVHRVRLELAARKPVIVGAFQRAACTRVDVLSQHR